MSTISNTVTIGVTLGVGGYTSPLTIAASGAISIDAAVGVYAGGTYANPVLVNQGSIINTSAFGNGVNFHDGGSVDNAGGLIQAYKGVLIYGAAGTVTNSGTIAAGASYGVRLEAGGAITNTGMISAGGGFVGAVRLGADGTVSNAGTIIGTLTNAVTFVFAGGSVGNSGLIQGASNGVYLENVFIASTVTNSGRITGASGSGVKLLGTGIVTNTGTITGVGAGGIGIRLAAGGTVIDSGTISGGSGTAVSFGGTGGNRLVLLPGYTLGGSVDAAGTANVLELGSAASAGTVSGIGSTFTNFASINVDAGAQWTLSGNNTLGSGVTLTDFGTLTNAGSLDASAGRLIVDPASFVNSGLISGTVTLSGGGTLDNQASGTISTGGVAVRGTLAAATVVNAGTILGNTPVTTPHNGIALYNGGNIANNAGYIRGYNGVGIAGAYGIVTNTGTIFGAGRQGVGLGAGGSVGNSGLIRGYIGGVYIGGGAGMVTNSGLILGFYGYGVRLAAGGTVINSGTIRDAAAGFPAVVFGGNGSNLLVLQSGYQFGGGVVGSATGTDTVELAGTVGAAVTASYNGLTLTNFENVLFGAGGYSTLLVSNAGTPGTLLGVTISGFDAASEVIDLTGIGADGTITGSDTLTDQIIVTGSSGSLTLQFDSIDGFNFTASPDGTGGTDLSPVCYCRGTMILTDRGEVAIEDLAIGDQVVTISGAAKPVKWIGRRAYDGRFVAGNRAVLPVRVAAGALADGVPARDLLVSPEHSLYIDGALVAVCHLLNGATITQESAVKQLEYFHIELETHEIIIANGAPAESYVDCDNRGRFHNAAEFAALYPGNDRPKWRFCAPQLQWESDEPNAIRAALMQRAETLGHKFDLDPDLHLVVDGAAVRPDSVDGRVYRFTIRAGAAAASLASRSAVPAEIRAEARDLRQLGVPVERLVLCDADLRIEVGHGHAGLADGFHDDEPSHRWTDGLARLPQSWPRSFPGAFTLEVHLITAELPYRLAAPSRTRAVA